MTDDIKKILLKDRTTNKNIIWASDDYENISATDEIKFEQINLIKSRYEKISALQKNRAKSKAEIFTPPEICAIQNNSIETKTFWRDYINKKILEITCGEAPYLANRYNTITGESIAIKNRAGILDRKLKVVGDITNNVDEWCYFAKKSVQSVYGYEFHGDSLFIARKNIFETVQDFFHEKFKFSPPIGFLKDIADFISWNLWQMDGLTYTIPFHKIKDKQTDLGFEEKKECDPCIIIMNWQEDKKNEPIVFKKLVESHEKKF